jgi:hypothetical protein
VVGIGIEVAIAVAIGLLMPKRSITIPKPTPIPIAIPNSVGLPCHFRNGKRGENATACATLGRGSGTPRFPLVSLGLLLVQVIMKWEQKPDIGEMLAAIMQAREDMRCCVCEAAGQ